MKFIFHVPTQQYGYIEVEGEEKDLEQMEVYYNKYAEHRPAFSSKKGASGLEKVVTFTGETIYYDDERHEYEDEKGNPLLSGSAFKKLNEKPFNSEIMCVKVGKKYGVPADTVAQMWEGSSKISTTIGTALHLALEQWFKFKESGTEKGYHITKNHILKEAINSFPLKDIKIIPEVFVSDVARLMVGQVDGIIITGEKKCTIIDYKTDADIKKNLPGHFLQLSFYASILIAHGWDVESIQVWNYTNKWECYESEVVDISTYKPFTS